MKVRAVAWLLAGVGLVSAAGAQAAYSNLFVFGDSLSDSGNNFIALGGVTTPVADMTGNSFIPTYPYASGNYTNGATWAQSFAGATGLGSLPSLGGGTNYAFGGARTSGAGFPYSLTEQTGMFLAGYGGVAPSSALYVVAGGGNNARDALAAIAVAPPADAPAIIAATAAAYAADVGGIVDALQAKGAQHIVVWDTPNVGLAPAITAFGSTFASLGTTVAGTMNAFLAARLGSEPADVQTLDVFGLMNTVYADPADYGFSNVTDACVQAGVACADPSTYFFWDGIHPTSGGQALLAREMYALAVPEPGTYGMLIVGLLVVARVARRRAA